MNFRTARSKFAKRLALWDSRFTARFGGGGGVGGPEREGKEELTPTTGGNSVFHLKKGSDCEDLREWRRGGGRVILLQLAIKRAGGEKELFPSTIRIYSGELRPGREVPYAECISVMTLSLIPMEGGGGRKIPSVLDRP